MEPDGVEGYLQLAVIEGAIVRGDDDVDLLGILAQLDTGLLQAPLEGLLRDGEDLGVRVVVDQPARRRHDRVGDVLDSGRQAQLLELVDVLTRILRRVVRQEPHGNLATTQLLNHAAGTGQEVVAEVDGAVHIEDIGIGECGWCVDDVIHTCYFLGSGQANRATSVTTTVLLSQMAASSI